MALWGLIKSAYKGCSTPSGIKAVLTGGAAGLASWSTWCSTPSGIKAVLTSSSISSSIRTDSAQRLPASKRFSPAAGRYELADRVVLNAFRHQSGSHCGRRHPGQHPHGVLNAFRHQSGSHVLPQTLSGLPNWCSTPSGIKAVLTRLDVAEPAARIGAQRLPASKRFSPVVLYNHDDWSESVPCSTPSGIKAVLTRQREGA